MGRNGAQPPRRTAEGGPVTPRSDRCGGPRPTTRPQGRPCTAGAHAPKTLPTTPSSRQEEARVGRDGEAVVRTHWRRRHPTSPNRPCQYERGGARGAGRGTPNGALADQKGNAAALTHNSRPDGDEHIRQRPRRATGGSAGRPHGRLDRRGRDGGHIRRPPQQVRAPYRGRPLDGKKRVSRRERGGGTEGVRDHRPKARQEAPPPAAAAADAAPRSTRTRDKMK